MVLSEKLVENPLSLEGDGGCEGEKLHFHAEPQRAQSLSQPVFPRALRVSA